MTETFKEYDPIDDLISQAGINIFVADAIETGDPDFIKETLQIAKQAKERLNQTEKNKNNKQQVTIRFDYDVLSWFKEQCKNGGNYQSMINQALREYVANKKASSNLNMETLQAIIKDTLRQELQALKAA